MMNREELSQSCRELLGELIRNACVNTGRPESGEEIRSVRTLEKFFAGFGLSGEIFTSAPGRSSLLVRIPGKTGRLSGGTSPTLMFMGHMDVVPAHDAGWTHPPFSGEIAGGRLWGRGALDMLGQTASMAAAAAEVYLRGPELPGDLLFLAVADEENAGEYGARYLVENHWDKVRTDYMITELGGYYLDLPGIPRAAFTVGEKGVTQLRIRASGRASHGSLPYGIENAALKLARLAAALGDNLPGPVPSEWFSSMLERMTLPAEAAVLLSDPLTLDRGLEVLSRSCPGTARLLHACSRMTVSPNVIRAGEKVNVIADGGFLETDIRTLPGQTREDWTRLLEGLFAELGEEYTVEVMESCEACLSPADTHLAEACAETVGALDPEVRLVPLLTSVATDGRFWRRKGTVVYGYTFLGRELTMDRVFRMIHGLDEAVPLESLDRELAFFRNLPETFFRKLTGGTSIGGSRRS